MERKVGDRIELDIEDIASGGEGVGKLDGFVVFVPGAAPGDRLEIELVVLKKKYARGRIVKVVTASRRRVKPPCPVYDTCGGCQLQHIDYDSQLTFKTKMVRDAVEHLGLLREVDVRPCRGMKTPWNYRNKAQMIVAGRPYFQARRAEDEPTELGGESLHAPRLHPYFGYYAQRSHRVIPIEECLIQSTGNNRLLQAARLMVERLQWKPFSEKTGDGLLRYVLARSTQRGDSLLVLVASQAILPHLKEFISAVRRKAPELKGVMVNVNSAQTNVILGSVTRTLWGSDYLLEDIDGLKFRISATSFFQINPWGLKEIYKCLDSVLAIRARDAILDAYCGVGSMSLYLASKARRVVGVDSSASAIQDAIINSDLNEFKNTYFTAGAAEKTLPRLYQQGERFTAAILDPPRKGCDLDVLNTVARMRIPKLVYVSCNPATLARDLGILKELGYQTDSIQPIDMFPHTYHVESVAALTRVGK